MSPDQLTNLRDQAALAALPVVLHHFGLSCYWQHLSHQPPTPVGKVCYEVADAFLAGRSQS